MSDPVRLLLIEDSEDDAELIRLELQRGGLELDWRRVQSEGELVEALGQEWDIIVSDFQMPSFNGLRAFTLYREAGLDAPFIFVSGALGEERAVEAMRAGARDYLLKGNLARLGVAVRRELAAAADRAAQRRAEEAAIREQRRLAVAVEASGAGVFEHSVPPDARSHHNERFTEILGLADEEIPPPEAVVQWVLERVGPEDREELAAAYLAFIEGRTERLHAEANIRHGEGHWLDVDISAHAVERDSSGRALHVVGVVLDLTERRRLEAQFRQAQKMEAIGRLAGGVAHDFNNLLTVIITSGEFVLGALEEDHPVREDVQEVLKTAARAGALTEQLLAFSRSKPVSPRVLNLNDIVQDVDGLVRRMVGKEVDVVTRLAPDLWNVRIDPGSLEQVLANLAVNARDAMPNGGTLTVETLNADLTAGKRRAEDTDIPPGRYVVVGVGDDGLGMDEATRRRIFEPFFTTKGPRKGTGLGLSTCYGIIRQAAGFIHVRTELGRGTTFEIYLPAVANAAERAPAREQRDATDEVGGSERILVVEDEDMVRRVVVRVLTGLGYQVIPVANGSEALAECEKAAQIDLLLTDVVLPEMSGREIARRAVELKPELKVLYMSGYTPESMVHQGVLDVEAHAIEKPFTPAGLGRKLRELLDA